MKKGIKIALWIAVAAFAWIAVSPDSSGSDPAGRGLSRAVGTVFGLAAAGAGVALLLAERPRDAAENQDGAQHDREPVGQIESEKRGAESLGRRGRPWLFVGGAILLLPFLLIGTFEIGGCLDSAKSKRNAADLQSGRVYFREQPALQAVANAIERNDEEAIRAALKNVPDVQAAGREGTTLLYFAVYEASVRPLLVKAVATLLSCGADPNYNNGGNSFVMERAVTGDVQVLRTLLDAGGNPNGRDFFGDPIIFTVFHLQDYERKCRPRLRLLLDCGADVNSTRLKRDVPGYTLLLSVVREGGDQPVAFLDALDLLERGADFNRAAQDRIALVKMLAEQRRAWSANGRAAPPEYEKLCDWLRQHGVFLEEG